MAGRRWSHRRFGGCGQRSSLAMSARGCRRAERDRLRAILRRHQLGLQRLPGRRAGRATDPDHEQQPEQHPRRQPPAATNAASATEAISIVAWAIRISRRRSRRSPTVLAWATAPRTSDPYRRRSTSSPAGWCSPRSSPGRKPELAIGFRLLFGQRMQKSRRRCCRSSDHDPGAGDLIKATDRRVRPGRHVRLGRPVDHERSLQRGVAKLRLNEPRPMPVGGIGDGARTTSSCSTSAIEPGVDLGAGDAVTCTTCPGCIFAPTTTATSAKRSSALIVPSSSNHEQSTSSCFVAFRHS